MGEIVAIGGASGDSGRILYNNNNGNNNNDNNGNGDINNYDDNNNGGDKFLFARSCYPFIYPCINGKIKS